MTVEVKCDSFFNLFEDIDPEQEQPKKEKPGKDDEDFEDEDDEMTDKLQDELDVTDQFKDDLVPLALEYYLGVIEIEDHDDGDDSEGGKGDDSDEDDKPKKKKKGKKGGADMPLGPDGKPQDCKQQ